VGDPEVRDAGAMSEVTLLVGTRKGLFLLSSPDRRSWTLSEPQHLGHVMQHVVADPRSGTILAATRTGHLGPTVLRSTDGTASWTEASRPPAFRAGEPLARAVEAVFWLTPGHPSQPGVWYAGATPQGLFRTDDDGRTWSPVDGWNDHPMWESWAEFPHRGTPDGAMLHSINVDPRDADHLYIGLSSGGVFESDDGATSWMPLNRGVVGEFLPDPDGEYGHDPHCVRLHPMRPDRLYQQNHCGLYRIDRPSDTWERIGDNLPAEVGDIGFPVELHPRDPDTAWVFPMDGTDVWPRTSPDGRPAVYVTRDGGRTFERQDRGFPERGWFTVKRQAMTTDADDPVGVYVGTTGGELWASDDEGATWACAARHLPEIFSVEVVPAGAS
jgi:photosystem II stability/assembly factor-like uncharacterized protein